MSFGRIDVTTEINVFLMILIRTWCSRSISFIFSIAADAARPVARAT